MIKTLKTLKTLKTITILAVLACSSCGTQKPTITYNPAPLHDAQQATTQAAGAIASNATAIESTANAIDADANTASTAPTTQAAAKPIADIITQVKNLIDTAGQLRATQKKVADLATTLTAVQQQVSKLASDAATYEAELAKSKAETKQAEAKYNDSWLGGKTWKAIFWISGITIALIIGDCLMFFFAGVGLNPLTLIIKLITGTISMIRGAAPVGTAPKTK